MKPLTTGVVFLFILFTTLSLHSQNQVRLDSLLYQLEMSRSDSMRVMTLISVSKEYITSDLPTSIGYAQKSLDLAETLKNDFLITEALMTLGFVCFYSGLLDLAARHYYHCLQIYRSKNNHIGIVSVLINIGSIKLQMHEFEEAKENYLEVLSYIEKNIRPEMQDSMPRRQLTTIYNNLGVIHHNLGEYDQAIDYYKRGIVIARHLPLQDGQLGNLLNNLGRTYDEVGRFDDALEVINEALKFRLAQNDKQGIGSSYRSLALLHKSINQQEKALQYLYEGLEMAEQVGALHLNSSIVKILFEHFDAANKADSALKYHKLLKEYNEEINKEETLRELTRLELTARFQEEELMRNLEQKRKEQRYAFVGGLLLLMAIIAGLLYFLANSRARRLQLLNNNIQLESQNTNLLMQNLEKELEVKNKELTTNVMYQIRKNELVNEITGKLMDFRLRMNKDNQELIWRIVKDLEKTQDESIWNEFELRFQQVHNDFYEKLHTINPDLTLNERRLCAFLRLNMTTKEISAITGQSPRSIEVARTRLRKKLHLTNSEANLSDFLLSV